MVNMKRLDFFNTVTGKIAKPEEYGVDGKVYRKSDNVDMIFDSRGQYLGLRTCRGKFIDGKYTSKKGIYDFKSFLDLNKYQLQTCGIDLNLDCGIVIQSGEQKVKG